MSNPKDTYTNDRTGQKFEEDWLNNDGKRMIKPIPQDPKRWRAEINDYYWFVDPNFNIDTTFEYDELHDDRRFESGNYFQTEHQAQLAADAIRELLKVIHESDNAEAWGSFNSLLADSVAKAREAMAES